MALCGYTHTYIYILPSPHPGALLLLLLLREVVLENRGCQVSSLGLSVTLMKEPRPHHSSSLFSLSFSYAFGWGVDAGKRGSA